jgi:hypothetical protein
MATVGWDRLTDRFTMGQWMKGRIETSQADISPDGRHWIYSGYRPSRNSPERWTAIAKVPYLKALSLAFCAGPGGPHGGGGVFLDNRTYYADGADTLQPQVHGSDFDGSVAPALERGEGFYSFRLRRDGWRSELRPAKHTVEELELMKRGHERVMASIRRTALEKPSLFRPDIMDYSSQPFQPPTQKFLLRSLPDDWELEAGPWDGSYPRNYRLMHTPSGQAIENSSWLWADWEPTGKRLVWTEGGFLRAARIVGDRIEPPQDLFDSNPLLFEAIEAPY